MRTTCAATSQKGNVMKKQYFVEQLEGVVKKFIETNVHDTKRKEEALKELAKKQLEADGRSGSYAYVKSWFLSEFKDEYNKSSFTKIDKNNSGAESNTAALKHSASTVKQETT